ncbi:TrmH family RNA methyltransferase [Lentiprolixibacter aurantiacus]|uniref:RNA methyltransferase n=1 Tax=Lentiprolixibacter aurantiacus TaxID=2993939 RepID=A0AAE3MK31_9FLAO|nr:RNA methyltransferase [Lentiprolixibacter aurantiacus]MCX2719215.1 RNA methyltransferase [Lentiprolixibacter aurantiacus]
MVVKSQLKYIKSLQQKKYRMQYKRFVAEGFKTVEELLRAGWKAELLFATETGLDKELGSNTQLISPKQMSQISSFKTPSKVLGVFEVPEAGEVDFTDWIVALDKVRDPGNLGTIIRLCDWFGITHLVCSTDTVEAFNPKVLQATMGSIARVDITYTDLPSFLKDADVPVFGAFMDGKSVYDTELPSFGILVMGNEANGISKEVSDVIRNKISIPQYGKPSAESLNVATATAILLNELRRS